MAQQSKRERLARYSQNLGLTRALERLPHQPCLIALNYHRIGDAGQTRYDSGVFSATADEFDAQVSYLKAKFRIIGLEEALEVLDRPVNSLRHASILLTFDDCYVDNYRLAFPILRSHGVQGTFFLPTSFIGTNRIPWWDKIAYLVRQSQRRRLRIEYPAPEEFDLETADRSQLVRRLLSVYKAPATTDPARFVRSLEEACEVPCPAADEPLFMNWAEAAEMVAGGMAFGSHTHNHELLAKLSPDQQYEEVRLSRQIIEEKLNIRCDVLAYPVGSRSAFSRATFSALERAGYRAAFSYYGGVNIPGAVERYNLYRTSVDSDLRYPLFRLRLALAAASGKELI